MLKRYWDISTQRWKISRPMISSAAERNADDFAANLLRETKTIMVDGTATIVYKDDIDALLYSKLYSDLYLNCWLEPG
jgi:hypothetical protein